MNHTPSAPSPIRTSPFRKFVQAHRVATYLVLAYALSWSIWPLVLLNPQSSPMVPFGPALAAVFVAAVAGGRRELGRLGRALVHLRAAPRWYLAAVGLPLVILAGAFGTALAQGAPAPRWDLSSLLHLLATLGSTVVIVGLFEEPGWRGFLLPLLQRRRGPLTAALLVGLAWLPWHLPELISDPSQRPVLPFAILVMAQSVLFAWLYDNSAGSLPVVILCHASFNSFAQFLLPGLQGAHYQSAWWVMAALTALAALAVAPSMRRSVPSGTSSAWRVRIGPRHPRQCR